MTFEVSLLSGHATVPVRGSAEAAGYDLSSAVECTVPGRGGRRLIPLDLAVRVPPGTYGRIAPRSGLASKKGIHVGAGVIDRDYCGNVGVLLFNHGEEDFKVSVGDRVAQMVLECVASPPVRVVSSLSSSDPCEGREEENTTEKRIRGVRGFGSTGDGRLDR